MGRADQRNGAGAVCSVEMSRLSAIKIITQECLLGSGGKKTNKQKAALTVLKQFISAFWKGMVGICLDVQKWLLLSSILFQLRAGVGVGCWVCCHKGKPRTSLQSLLEPFSL